MDQLQQELKAERIRHQETGRQLSQLKKTSNEQQEELETGQRKEREAASKVCLLHFYFFTTSHEYLVSVMNDALHLCECESSQCFNSCVCHVDKGQGSNHQSAERGDGNHTNTHAPS